MAACVVGPPSGSAAIEAIWGLSVALRPKR